MTQKIKDSFLDLERHRQLLEKNIEKLRASLRHWQMWEAEYEGLKEEILAAEPPPTHEQLQEIGRQYEGELVNQKEVGELLGGSTIKRTAAQVVNLLDRRIDYVEQNVLTVKKQIETAENKLAAATIISTPDVRNEEGLPLTEIVEELDDDGNVVSGHTSTPGSAKPQLLEVLKKAGVENIPDTKLPPRPKERLESAQKLPDGKFVSVQKQASPMSSKKGVKFTPDTKAGPGIEKTETAKRIEGIMNIAKQLNAPPTEPPVIPENESTEDAVLRRQMLEYGMSEVGAVVAELELEEGSDWSDEDYDEDETVDTDDEDEFGRSTGRIVDDALRQQMIELEERLGARVMENIGNKASDYDVVEEGIGRVTISTGVPNVTTQDVSKEFDDSNNTSQSPIGSSKKSVRFSEELDISPAPTTRVDSVILSKKSAPIADIVERQASFSAPTPVSSSQKRVSRFKLHQAGTTNQSPKTRPTTKELGNMLTLRPAKSPSPKPFSVPIQYQPAIERTRIAPTGPEGKTLANAIVERDIPIGATVTEPDELDPQLLHQEVLTEYHKARNRMIHRQGGFLQEEESAIVPLTEEEGGPKKMSRFKAARLAKS
ncbi:Prefoldin subunit-domain-containing protein [Tricladium varicosporioides]|nr:Prefoldin subunit-domain-containing protein [Hymenoscyphus varicosporioides]